MEYGLAEALVVDGCGPVFRLVFCGELGLEVEAVEVRVGADPGRVDLGFLGRSLHPGVKYRRRNGSVRNFTAQEELGRQSRRFLVVLEDQPWDVDVHLVPVILVLGQYPGNLRFELGHDISAVGQDILVVPAKSLTCSCEELAVDRQVAYVAEHREEVRYRHFERVLEGIGIECLDPDLREVADLAFIVFVSVDQEVREKR